MKLWKEFLRLVQCAEVKVNFVGEPLRFISQGRSALPTETTSNTSGRFIELAFALSIGDLSGLHTNECGDRRTRIATTTLAMAMTDPYGVTCHAKLNGPAEPVNDFETPTFTIY